MTDRRGRAQEKDPGRVLIVTGSMKRGGAERVISILAGCLAERGRDVVLLTTTSPECGYPLDERIRRRHVSGRSDGRRAGGLQIVREIRRCVREEQPGAVLSFMIPVNIAAWAATRGLDVRFIPSERNDPAAGRRLLYRLLQRRVYGDAYRVVFQSERARAYFPERIRQKGVVIPNPCEVRDAAEGPREAKIVTAGRLEPQKNQALLIRAFADIAPDYPAYRLEIYGEGSCEKVLSDLAGELGVRDAVVFRGNQADLPEQIADAAVFVLPSDFEGMSNALLEAMSLGLPCISTDCAGSDELIRDGSNGFLIPVRDRQALAAKIRILLDSEALRQELGRNARQTIQQKCDPAKIADRWEALLPETVKR
ncbi:MAG: glycosyltransferase [Mogibacterium sp.]|nr:glycosyltransferase [Mogibacterium sp.]